HGAASRLFKDEAGRGFDRYQLSLSAQKIWPVLCDRFSACQNCRTTLSAVADLGPRIQSVEDRGIPRSHSVALGSRRRDGRVCASDYTHFIKPLIHLRGFEIVEDYTDHFVRYNFIEWPGTISRQSRFERTGNLNSDPTAGKTASEFHCPRSVTNP